MSSYIGKQVDLKHVDEAKKSIIQSDEEIEGIFHCGIVRRSGSRGLTLHDYLIITDKRAIAWGRGLLSKNVESFDYDKIANVQAHQGLLAGEIEFNVFGAKERFAYMVKSDVPVAIKMINEHITNLKGKENSTVSVEGRLEKLGQLLEKGLITKAEFATQKKKILSA